MRTAFRSVTGLVTALVILAGSWTPASAQAPIKIGASLSLTGTYAALGQNQPPAANLRFEMARQRRVTLFAQTPCALFHDRAVDERHTCGWCSRGSYPYGRSGAERRAPSRTRHDRRA